MSLLLHASAERCVLLMKLSTLKDITMSFTHTVLLTLWIFNSIFLLQLGIVGVKKHPVFRHSLLNFDHINILDSKESDVSLFMNITAHQACKYH